MDSDITIFKIIKEYVKENTFLFLAYCLMIISLPINEVLLPHLYGKVIYNLQAGLNVRQYIFPIILCIILVQVIMISNDLIDVRLYPKMITFIRKYCMDKIISARSSEMREMEIGKLIAKLVRFPTMLYSYIEIFKDDLVPYCIIYVVIIIYMFLRDKVISLLIMFIVAVLLLCTYKAATSCIRYSQLRDRYYNMGYEEIDEIMRNMVSILNNNSYEYETQRLNNIDGYFKEYAKQSLYCSNKYKIIFDIFFTIMMAVISYRLIYLYRGKIITNSSIVSIAIILLFMFNTVMKHTNTFKNIMFRYGTIQESLTLFSEEARKNQVKINYHEPYYNTKYCIMLNNVSFLYKQNKPILSNFNLNVSYRENLLIMGEIGSGKSTILKLIMKYQVPQEGELYLDGIPYSTIQDYVIRDKIGYIHQNPLLFNRTLMENIKYGNRSASDQEVYDLINKIGVNSIIERFPDKLNTIAGKSGSNLSGGEKQIIWILRVLLHNPKIILMDEPTSAMDEGTRDILFNIMVQLMKEKTVITVSHDPNMIQYYNRIIYLKDGKMQGEQIKNT